MTRLILSVIISLIVSTVAVIAQKEHNNWYFGDSAGITFNTPSGEPVVLTDGVMFSNACSSVISDSLGTLLFYTNGEVIFNRFHQIMKNGEGLKGTSVNLQSSIIVPKPGFDYIYYVFTTEGLFYSIVDMSKENGMGAVITKNVFLMDNKFGGIAAVGHNNGKDVWIVTRNFDEKCLVSYLLTENGIENIPVKSSDNIVVNKFRVGLMKISPDGKKLALTSFPDVTPYERSRFSIFDFNDKTGEITNGINFSFLELSMSLEFSPNSRYLYVSSDLVYLDSTSHSKQNVGLCQYDISIMDSLKIIESKITLYSSTNYGYSLGNLQLGPNKKIYVSNHDNKLSVVHKPDLHGLNCDFKFLDFELLKPAMFGLPNFVQKYFPKKLLWQGDTISVCENDTLKLLAPRNDIADYVWTGPNGFSSFEKNPFITNTKIDMSGNYFYTVKHNGLIVYRNKFYVIINPVPQILFANISYLTVYGDSYNLRSVENPFRAKINWTGINSSENTVKITKSGKYSVMVENEYGCNTASSINIEMKSPLCEGDYLRFMPMDYQNAEYHWKGPQGFDSENKILMINDLKVSMSGEYNLKIIIRNDTTGIIEKIINNKVVLMVYPIEKILFSNKSDIYTCLDSVELTAVANADECFIEWQGIDSDENKVIIRKSGKYGVRVRNKSGCVDSATINVYLNDNIKIQIQSNKTGICDNEPVYLTVNDTYNEYLWSTGETTPEIKITKGGKYILKVRTEAGCEGIDSITIQEFEKPEVAFAKSLYRLCEGEILTVKPIEIEQEYNYLWSDGIAEPERTFTENAELYLIASSENGCSDTAYIKVEFLEMPVSSILADNTEACFGEKITLKADNFNPEFSYLWSNGETTESITVTVSGTYKLIITNNNLCSETAEIEVKIHPDLVLEILADKTNLCFDDSTKIYTSNTYSDYLWSTGETTPIITVKDAGIYKLIVKNEFGCADTAEIEIFKYDANIEFDKENIIFDELCVGDFQIENLKMTIKTETEFTISSITTTSNSFEIVNKNSLIKTYKNGDIVNIEIKFKPLDAGIFDDELVIHSSEPCEFSKSIPISASAKQVLDFSFDEHFSIAGQSLEIPLLGQIKCPAPQNLTTDYEIEVAFDKEYFAPERVKFGQIISNEIVGNERIIKVKADGEFMQTKSEINVIYGNALLGRSEVSPIIINNVKLSKNRYFLEYLNGSLNVDGCVNDITSIKMFTPTKMSISPNPTDGELKVSIATQEQGSFSLVVFDLQGREVFRTAFSKSDKTFEQKDYNINTLQLGNGIYTIHLTAPWTLHREQVVVVR